MTGSEIRAATLKTISHHMEPLGKSRKVSIPQVLSPKHTCHTPFALWAHPADSRSEDEDILKDDKRLSYSAEDFLTTYIEEKNLFKGMKNVTYSKSSAFCNRVLNDRRNEFGCLEDFLL